MADKTITFTLPSGTRVTCSPELAARLGHKPQAPARKSATKTGK